MKKNYLETIVGFLVILIAGSFFLYAYSTTNAMRKAKSGYVLYGNFENIEGIVEGSNIMLAGITIGQIDKMTLDPKDFSARLKMRINGNIKLPVDSKASIATSGFIGNKYVNITPGLEEESMNPNDTFKYTQSSLNIESLINKLLFSFTSKPQGSAQ